MFSLLQQTAPTAVQTTPATPQAGASTTTVTVPIADATATTPVVPAPADPAVVVTPAPTAPVAVAPAADAQTHATDALHVPGATGADSAAPVAETGLGHAPAAADAGHAVVAADGTHAVVTHAVPGTDAAHAVAAGGHEAAASAGMPQLDFSSFGNQIFWLLITLAVIYLILSRVALPRIGRILADRQGLMTSDLATAEDFKRKARDAEAAYDKALANARVEAGKIVAANKAEIDAELKAAIARADAEISARAVESERRIGEIRASAAQDVRTVARDVAAELVRAFGGNPDPGALDTSVDARMKGAVQ